jgi:hypothetical protein
MLRRVQGFPTTDGSWRDLVVELAAFDRGSASEGERRAAELVAERLRAFGCETSVEREQAHGTYWWPIGIANLIAVAGALSAARGRRFGRALGALAAGVAAAALWDDLGHGRRWFRRSLLPQRPTWNVLAWTGNPDATRTVAFIAHHDAAHSGLVFHPALGRIGPKLLPRLHERSSHTLPILYGVWLGPALVCAGALLGRGDLMKVGATVALGAIGTMADIGARGVVAGANDNLAAVGALVALAERLQRSPVEGVRVLLLSTGSEESFSEGMQTFIERHAHELDRRARSSCAWSASGARRSSCSRERACCGCATTTSSCATLSPPRLSAPASTSSVACGRWQPPMRSSRCEPAIGRRRSLQSLTQSAAQLSLAQRHARAPPLGDGARRDRHVRELHASHLSLTVRLAQGLQEIRKRFLGQRHGGGTLRRSRR